MLGEGNVISVVGREGFMIGGNKGTLKNGDTNPLTGDKLISTGYDLNSESTAREIEVWMITLLD